MKYFLPTHCDSGNRGCEAIIKATAELLGSDSMLVALSNDIQGDTKLGINEYSTLVAPEEPSLIDKLIFKFRYHTVFDKFKKRSLIYGLRFNKFFQDITISDVMLSTGGDMFCYEDNEAVYTSMIAQRIGCKTVLWGCSIGKRNLTDNKLKVLRKFDMIYVRESLSKKVLEAENLSNVVLYPDPAFILNPEPIKLPYWMSCTDTIGINISNYVMGGFNFDTPFAKEFLSMIDYILENTNLMIMLVPHVLWNDQDDTVVSKILSERYAQTKRVYTLDTNSMGYCQIRYVISKCRFFIGGRTHSVISAYSTCVPTIALGYSIKSKGIAKDLGLPEETVVDSKGTVFKDIMIDAFKYLVENESILVNHLKTVMPDYKSSVFGIKNELYKLIEK